MALPTIHSVVRAWYDKGQPRTDEGRHSFRMWAQTLDWIVQNIFQSAPLMDDHESLTTRLSRPGLGFVRQLAVKLEAAGRLGQDLRATDLYNLAEETQLEIPGMNPYGYDDESKGARQVGRLMRRAFGEDRQLLLEEYTVEVDDAEPTETSHHTNRTYCFQRTEGVPGAGLGSVQVPV